MESVESVENVSVSTLINKTDKLQELLQKLDEKKRELEQVALELNAYSKEIYETRATIKKMSDTLLQQKITLDKNYNELMLLLKNNHDFDQVERLKRISILFSTLLSSQIDDVLFHAALETRHEIIIRLFLTRVPVSRIKPDQLEFFIPFDSSKKGRDDARALGNILFEHKYRFQTDETSQSFFNVIMKNDMTHGH